MLFTFVLLVHFADNAVILVTVGNIFQCRTFVQTVLFFHATSCYVYYFSKQGAIWKMSSVTLIPQIGKSHWPSAQSMSI